MIRGMTDVSDGGPSALDPEVAAPWKPWRVAPASAFEVADAGGVVGMAQVDEVNFVVTTGFRFSDADVQAMLEKQIRDTGKSEQEAQAMVADACNYTLNTEDMTDMASIPRFMRWFENTYGLHTLAAIIHDRLITSGEPNSGPLGSDTLSDRFFREMMHSAGVPWLKRWIMWAAVAMRSRWAAGGLRRITVLLWIAIAAAGISLFVGAAGAAIFGWGHVFDPWVMLILAVVLPLVSAPLWGRQYGAALVAALAALWILPAAGFALLGYLVYRVLERIVHQFARG
jgi:Protein of unknown function (DUF1353)